MSYNPNRSGASKNVSLKRCEPTGRACDGWGLFLSKGGGDPLPIFLILLLLSGCAGAKIRYDAAPAPIDLNQHTVLLETDCNGVNRIDFGQAGCSWRPDEAKTGTLTVHTPLPGSIQLVGRECGVDETAFHPEQGGSFKYDLARLAQKMEDSRSEYCRINIFVRWQLPAGMSSEYVLRGMSGRLYLRKTRPNASKPALSWTPATGGLGPLNGLAWAQFRASSVLATSEPLRLKVQLPGKAAAGKYRAWGCGHGAENADFQGDSFALDRETLVGAAPQMGACDLFGYAVANMEDGSRYDGDLVVAYEVFDVKAQKLAVNVRMEGSKVCYDAEDTVSLAVLNYADTNKGSNKLSDCFSMPEDGHARLGFFTHQGRAVYAVLENGTVTYLQ